MPSVPGTIFLSLAHDDVILLEQIIITGKHSIHKAVQMIYNICVCYICQDSVSREHQWNTYRYNYSAIISLYGSSLRLDP